MSQNQEILAGLNPQNPSAVLDIARKKLHRNHPLTSHESYSLLRMTIMYMSCMISELDKNTRRKFARRFFPMSDTLMGEVYSFAKRDFGRNEILNQTKEEMKSFKVSYLKKGIPVQTENIEHCCAEFAAAKFHLKHQLAGMTIEVDGRYFCPGEIEVQMWERKDSQHWSEKE